MIKFNLSNRIAIVTGGAQGFGLAIAKKFLDCGAEVIVWDIDKSALNKTQESIKNEKFTTQIVDITNFNEVTIFYKDKKINDEKLYMKKKSEISDEIIDRVISQLN